MAKSTSNRMNILRLVPEPAPNRKAKPARPDTPTVAQLAVWAEATKQSLVVLHPTENGGIAATMIADLAALTVRPGLISVVSTDASSRAKAWAKEGGSRSALMGLWSTTPDDEPAALTALLRSLTSPPHGVTQREAARRLCVAETTLRRWLAPEGAPSHRNPPWAAVELLRRMLVEDVGRR